MESIFLILCTVFSEEPKNYLRVGYIHPFTKGDKATQQLPGLIDLVRIAERLFKGKDTI